jgi:ABC-type multidrug transport system permease subunit
MLAKILESIIVACMSAFIILLATIPVAVAAAIFR